MSNTNELSASTSNLIAIIGAGPAGMIVALELARLNFSSLLIGPKTDTSDLRTTALMMPAIKILDQINVWTSLLNEAAPLSIMRIVDATKRLIRSPSVCFRASEIGEKAFGYNMPNLALNRVLESAVVKNPLIKRIDDKVQAINHLDDGIKISLSTGQSFDAKLLIAADGRNSRAREAARIETRSWQYPQTAVILSFSHSHPHNNTSTEFHTEEGPFTQVPLPGNRSSLVWVANPQHANALLCLGQEGLARAIERHMRSILGKIVVDTPAQCWPLAGVVPKTFAANRTILIGEAAHIFPPIGAQGLNLSIRDAVTIASILVDNNEKPEIADDYGAPVVIREYNKLRRPDIWFRTGAVDALNRALLSNLFPAQIVRFAGLETLRRIQPLRAFFMREGMAPGGGFERLFSAVLPNFYRR